MFTKNHNINKGRIPWNKGKSIYTEEQKKQISERMKGKLSGNKHPNYNHGMAGSKPYQIWNWMMTRCNNPKNNNFLRYGAKGIKVSKEWEKFVNFWSDMENTYFDGASLERIDNKLGYSKENCKWITKAEQAKNKSTVDIYEYNGEKLCSMDWDKKMGFRLGTINHRIKTNKWSFEKALLTPKKVYTDPGIHYCKERKKWVASVKRNGKYHFVGRFLLKEDAIKAREEFLCKT